MRTGKESERVTCFPRVCDATLRGAGADPTRARSLECSFLPVSRRCTKETAREPEPAHPAPRNRCARDRELGQRRERRRQRTAAAATAAAAEALRQGARQLSAGRRQLTAHSSSAPRPLSARSARAGSVRHLTCTFPLQIVFLSFGFQFTLADSSNMLDAQSQLKAHAQTARSWWRRSTHARNPGAHARGGAVSGSWWRVWRLADALLHNGC
ncbi:uncharacterized protein LOC124594433 [Schistocerca americana]|uniref:uncharacterized protein LOC124594433 n=1 Tax=Schistocerca americana TaxID=7009 RepID=UPI001F4F2A52|nr:uncharacterized protein LOC124594433 [Schistocerca americana]